MSKQIEHLITTWDEAFIPCKKGKFPKEPNENGFHFMDECSVKHLGNQIYLIGYFDFSKAGGSILGKQNMINKYMILFPSMIKKVSFK